MDIRYFFHRKVQEKILKMPFVAHRPTFKGLG